jgi:hypothetical protein
VYLVGMCIYLQILLEAIKIVCLDGLGEICMSHR